MKEDSQQCRSGVRHKTELRSSGVEQNLEVWRVDEEYDKGGTGRESAPCTSRDPKVPVRVTPQQWRSHEFLTGWTDSGAQNHHPRIPVCLENVGKHKIWTGDNF